MRFAGGGSLERTRLCFPAISLIDGKIQRNLPDSGLQDAYLRLNVASHQGVRNEFPALRNGEIFGAEQGSEAREQGSAICDQGSNRTVRDIR